jgi:hypothetical protein
MIEIDRQVTHHTGIVGWKCSGSRYVPPAFLLTTLLSTTGINEYVAQIMNSESQICRQVIAEISQTLRQPPPATLTFASYHHLSTCSRCRVGLLLLTRAFDSEPGPLETSISCDACQADLPAYIDLETEDPASAAAMYPHVWWHLWTCEECSQTYEFTHVLLDAQRAGQIAPLRLHRRTTERATPVFKHLHLTRPLLMAALPRRIPAISASRGSDNRYVLFDDSRDEPERQRFTIVAEEQGDEVWQVIITVIPPPNGLLVLTFGTHRFVGPFALDGTATIRDIPSDVLMHPTGPEMEIDIVTVE